MDHNIIHIRGLIVLLVSKAAAAGYKTKLKAHSYNISNEQRSLAEMTDMIYSSQLIHQSLINISNNASTNNKELDSKKIHMDNILSILIGDYLLANVWKGLSELKNTQVVELMAKSVSDFVEGYFLFDHQSHLNYENNLSFKIWKRYNFLMNASLQANSCLSAMLLAKNNNYIQKKAFNFGKNFAYAWQIMNEIEPFLHCYTDKLSFNIFTLPILFYIQENNLKLDNIKNEQTGEINYEKLHHCIINGSSLNNTRYIKNIYADKAINEIIHLPVSNAMMLLMNIVKLIRQK